MIKSIRLQNFFGFQDCTINLEKGENVLVGINGSGKSNFFKAIKLLKEGVSGKGLAKMFYDEWGGFTNVIFKGRDYNINPLMYLTFDFDPTITWEYKNLDLKEISYEFGIWDSLPLSQQYNLIDEKVVLQFPENSVVALFNSQGTVTLLDVYQKEKKVQSLNNPLEFALPQFREKFDLQRLYEFISNIDIYDSFDTSKESKMRFGGFGSGLQKLNPDGSNLTQVLNYLQVTDKQSFNDIISALHKVNEKFSSITFQSFPNTVQIMLDENPFNSPIHVTNISDGTLRFLCLLAIFYNPNRGKVICIDEPELGLHPDMINTLVEAIRHAAETSQIIISTHSPELLNHFDVENIRVFEKDENNATVVQQYEVKQFDNFMNKYMPGQLWRQGHLGGNRW